MPAGGGGAPIYSIQRTYIINTTPTSNAFALTCNQRIDVPVIEPLTDVQAVVYNVPRTVVPCVELICPAMSLEELNLVFETNEGETVLPIKIDSGQHEPPENPYPYERWVLALPRGTTGIKSCKVLEPNGYSIQHNFTFGIMPPPYNYDNALFGYLSYGYKKNEAAISELYDTVSIAFSDWRCGLYDLQVSRSRFPLTTTPIPEDINLSMIKFRVTNKTGAKTSLDLEFTYRTAENAKGNDIFAVPIADGDNSVIIDIDKGTITTIADSTAIPFMISFPAKYKDHAITALNKASISGDTSSELISYSYYFKLYLMPQG